MFNKRDKVKKEYLKYKDGKVISFEDEKLEKEIKPSVDIRDLKEKTNEKVKELGPQKLIKLIGIIALVLFTIYVGVVVYKDFKAGEIGTKEQVVTTEEGDGLLGLGTSTVEEKVTRSNEQVRKKGKVTLLSSFNDTNSLLYQATVNDFARLNDYENKTLNRISLTNELRKQLSQKESLKASFIKNESLYKGTTEELLYETLLSRINNSITLSNELIAELDLSVKTKDMDSVIDRYNEKELVLKENEIILLKKYLDSKKIEYKEDRETGILKYDY